mmetsp:Transcript_42114/g.75645  ORF Transcript_42114/g.75645 Transcript_42114/m.75645 type:complete len:228 (-) Transcript_42114:856-1539(-)
MKLKLSARTDSRAQGQGPSSNIGCGIAVILRISTRQTLAHIRRYLLALRTILHEPRQLGHLFNWCVIATGRLVPAVVMCQKDLSVNTTIPTKLKTALAGDMVAFLLCFVTSTIVAASGTRFPAEGQCILPSLVLTLLHCLFLVQFVKLLITGETWVWTILALRTKAMSKLASEISVVIVIFTEDTLLAAQRSALDDSRIISREELQEFMIGLLWKALLEDVDGILRS